jgi:hypothetical protein
LDIATIKIDFRGQAMRGACGVIAAAYVALSASGALAQMAIGEMAEVRGDVTGAFRGTVTPLRNGNSVVQNQTVSTGVASTGRVAFHDLTSLSLAPSSSVVLDRYVYNAEGTVSSATLGLARGAFRIVSGRSPSQNIGVKTPTATIGLRGTVVDVLIGLGREIVILQQGAMTVCRAQQCVPVDQPGLAVVVTGAGVSAPSPAPQAEFNFDVLTQNRFQLYAPFSGSPGGDNPGGASPSSSGDSHGSGGGNTGTGSGSTGSGSSGGEGGGSGSGSGSGSGNGRN